MRVIQIYTILAYGDGVTNFIANLCQTFKSLQIENYVYAYATDDRCQIENVRLFNKIEDISLMREDIVFYHFANGGRLNAEIQHIKHKKILVYHNVTPPNYYENVDEQAFESCLHGRYEARQTVGNYMKAISMSEYSKRELVDFGWPPGDVYVIPLNKKMEVKMNNGWKDDTVNILYVGRIAPNKKIEDLIRVFNCYNKNYNSQSRLTIVGANRHPIYWKYLSEILDELKNKNITFRGHVTDEELDLEYRSASLYLSMSEHEGFCIPLMEAMAYRIPVMAFAAAAVPDTIGGAGVLFDRKEPFYVSEIIDEIVHNKDKRNAIIERQIERLEDFNIDKYTDILQEIIESVNELAGYEYQENSDFFYYENKRAEDKKDSIDFARLEKEAEYVVYGCGMYGKKLVSALIENGYSIAAICDNYATQSQYDSISVLGLDACTRRYPNATYIVSSVKNVVQMVASLTAHAIPESQIKVYVSQSNTII